MKRTLSLDFDGVCHLYVSPWVDAATIPDPPVTGLFEFLAQASVEFDIVIHSSRARSAAGVAAIEAWFAKHYAVWVAGGEGREAVPFKVMAEKPSAFITLDDRALTFKGRWPSLVDLTRFKPWNRPIPQPTGRKRWVCVECGVQLQIVPRLTSDATWHYPDKTDSSDCCGWCQAINKPLTEPRDFLPA